MNEHTNLDNLTCQEIKELINDKKIDFSSIEASVLQRLVDYEMDLLCVGKGDVEFIERCTEHICKNTPSMMTHDDYVAIVHNEIDKNTEVESSVDSKKRFGLKRVLLIAAIVSLLLLGLAGVASAFGFDLEYMLNYISGRPVGTTETIDGNTYHHAEIFGEYASVEELLEKENLNILYPTKFPDGISVQSVRVMDSTPGERSVIIKTNDVTTINIELNAIPVNSDFSDCEEYSVNEYKYYIFEFNQTCCAFAYINGNSYTISASNYNDLIFILDNMEE